MRTYITFIGLSVLFSLGCKEGEKGKDMAATESETAAQSETTSPSKAIEIYPVEHATAVIRWGEVTLYVDPVGGAETFSAYPSPDLILITDIHGDHFSAETLEALDTSDAKIIVPQAVADKLPVVFAPQVDVLNNGDTKERLGIKIEAIPMYNLREEARDFHVKGRGNGYVLTLGEERLYFSGDTEDIPEMRALKNIDKAFVCMNLPYTMTVDRAADAVLEFKPKQVYPYHYRGRPEVSDVAKFAELVSSKSSDITVVQLDWYPSDPF
ncbi:L-ascorbate metabolism protein UlaG, beta-lactamase superfamily [Muriicola jejuensis]|uniref:MBL fold metallo-hydrolase n=1 Tax=Muriicola jejuensis TaxID=504488 RepID=A0A6P0UJ87_9FLAO|nr:MBL fold metallo-hydrolase [Muriicola jejuensis]NER11143.1 MBL fold metallo-hydrolase [Muriicola jejuensis]SMP24051.1 L-ascorbate metabolism protein UlaG, beta-lactamase superfamily [Muriicola jejuensis]